MNREEACLPLTCRTLALPHARHTYEYMAARGREKGPGAPTGGPDPNCLPWLPALCLTRSCLARL